MNKLRGSPQASEVRGVKYIGLSLPFTSPCLSPMRTLRASVQRSHILHLCEATTRRSTWHVILRTTSRVKFDRIQLVGILNGLFDGTYTLTFVTVKLCSLCVLDNCSHGDGRKAIHVRTDAKILPGTTLTHRDFFFLKLGFDAAKDKQRV